MTPQERESVMLAQKIKDMKDNLPAYIDLCRMQAQMTRIRYLALVSEGFTSAEAIELCKTC